MATNMREVMMMRYATKAENRQGAFDSILWLSLAVVLVLGLVMMYSASISTADRIHGDALYFFNRQLVFMLLGLIASMIVFVMPFSFWQSVGPLLLVLSILLLALILIPGIGKTINGSTRWLNLGFASVQISEMVKLFMILYMAGYLNRHLEKVRDTWRGFMMPICVLALIALLLLVEPDFGATVVVAVCVMTMLLLAGARLRHFLIVFVLTVAAFIGLAVTSPYRMQRLSTFLDPWADPFNSGFQLSQSLIAFGRGEWLGVGLGDSVQKLFYLPEAHTDFVFAVLGEELGFVGVAFVILLYTMITWRALVIGRVAEKMDYQFRAYLAYGVGVWVGFQAFVNIGVNMGVLPTKGLTLPLMSYGGTSMVVSIVTIAFLVKVDLSNRRLIAEKGQLKL
ncbi:MAG: putative lipid II flippase FtsW [Gammaproteobacteria bacterium]|nr:putative lipid II flippase FtsW [Gammaproteobacteria bacterium]MDH5729538.1 putative lipid II flippase FtsW [Gammaproteobacteria bacterium]